MKIGILLPSAYDLGLLSWARRLALVLGSESGPTDHSYSIAIGIAEPSERRWREVERELRAGNPNTVVRHLQWEKVPLATAQRMFAQLSDSLDFAGLDEVTVPRDWGWNFQDCDAIIVCGDPALGAVLPLVPTLFYCTDLAVRIVPEAYASSIEDPYWNLQTDAFRMWRQSVVVTSDQATVEDIVSYAGVRRERTILCPDLFGTEANPDEAASDRRDPGMLAWLMRPNALHDPLNALRGLQMYLSEGGSLQPTIVRDGTAKPGRLDEYPFGLPEDVANLLYGLPSQVVMSERELKRILSRAGALWSSRIAGGEGRDAALAAECGTAFLGVDYEINRSSAECRGVNALFYPNGDPLAITDALHRLQSSIGGKSVQVAAITNDPIRQAREFKAIVERLIGSDIGS